MDPFLDLVAGQVEARPHGGRAVRRPPPCPRSRRGRVRRSARGLGSFLRPAEQSIAIRKIPIEIALSATMKDGQWWSPTKRSTKSVTAPLDIRSIRPAVGSADHQGEGEGQAQVTAASNPGGSAVAAAVPWGRRRRCASDCAPDGAADLRSHFVHWSRTTREVAGRRWRRGCHRVQVNPLKVPGRILGRAGSGGEGGPRRCSAASPRSFGGLRRTGQPRLPAPARALLPEC